MKKKKFKHWPTPLYNSAPSLAHHLCTFRAYLSTASGIQLLFYHPLCFLPCLGCTVPLSTTLNWWYNTKSLHQSPFIFFFNCVFFIYILTNFKRKKEQKKKQKTQEPHYRKSMNYARRDSLVLLILYIYTFQCGAKITLILLLLRSLKARLTRAESQPVTRTFGSNN